MAELISATNRSVRVRKKSVVVDAMLWAGNATPIIDWILDNGGTARYHSPTHTESQYIAIDTLEGTIKATPGNWIIKGTAGEFYPCKPHIFDKIYEQL